MPKPAITDWEKLTPKQQDHVTRIVEATTDEELAECFLAQKLIRIQYKTVSACLRKEDVSES